LFIDDSDSEFNDGEEGDFDLFGRLEESRAQLEEALGADKLIQVYKTVQVNLFIFLCFFLFTVKFQIPT